jgi:uncharacterized protein (TIGR02217 family)
MPAIFNEILLDPEYAAGASGGPEFSTAIISSPAGVRQRNVNRLDAIHKWTINYDLLSETGLESLERFFYVMQGMAVGFRFQPPKRYTSTGAVAVVNQEAFATADGAQTRFPLYLTYTAGSRQYVRRIVKPTADVTIFYGPSRLPLSNIVSYVVDTVEGVVVCLSPPPLLGTILYWSGGFHVPVSFGRDTFDAQYDLGGVSEVGGMDVVEMLPVELGLDVVIQPVQWNLAGGATQSGQLVTAGGGGAWSSGGYSAQQVETGDCWTEGIVDDFHAVIQLGLSADASASVGYADMDFAVRYESGTIKVFENGVQVFTTAVGAYVVSGQRIRAAVEDGAFRAYAVTGSNHTLLYESLTEPVYPLKADVSFGSAGLPYTFRNVVIAY